MFPEWRIHKSCYFYCLSVVRLRLPALDWAQTLAQNADLALKRGGVGIMEGLTTMLEKNLIQTALAHGNGRRIEAVQLLGPGRNALTRKIQELGLENGD